VNFLCGAPPQSSSSLLWITSVVHLSMSGLIQWLYCIGLGMTRSGNNMSYIELIVFTHKENWRHCHGELNPADLPSWGPLSELKGSTTWWKRPSFLQLWLTTSKFVWNLWDVKLELVKYPPPVTLALLSQGWESYCMQEIQQPVSLVESNCLHFVLCQAPPSRDSWIQPL